MRHKVFGKKLGRSVGQRNALRRTMITQLFQHERITTTHAKAQAIRGAAEHMITQAKRGLAADDPARIVYLRRLLNGRLDNPEIAQKVFDVLAPRYATRPGGYTRIYKLGPRKGDSAQMVILELVDRENGGESTSSTTNVVTRGASRTRDLLGRLRSGRPRGSGAASSDAAPASDTPAESTGS
jgi:large subunit ribosomal protein L17